MFAVIKSGGHQYKVSQGDVLDVDRIEGSVGDKVAIEKVLMLDNKVGTPFLPGAKVEAKIKKQYFADKVLVFKYKRRKNYKKTYGHKQPKTQIEISSVKG